MTANVVIGGGLTGLTLAHALRTGGEDVVLVEERGEAGGNLRTRVVENAAGRWLLELGPNSFGDAQADTMGLIRTLGLEGRLVLAPPETDRRWIFRDGALCEVPAKPQKLLLSPVVPLLGRLRLLCEPFVPPRPPEMPEESLAEFCDRRLGRAARDKLLTSVIGGIYAGDPEKLGAESTFPRMVAMEREYGSLIRAARRGGQAMPSRGRLASFVEGLRELPQALVASLGGSVRLAAPVDRVEPGGGAWATVLRNGERIVSERVFVTTPSWRAGEILGHAAPALGAELAAIHYAPVAVVHVGLRREADAAVPAGFGFLVPRNEGLRILGTIFSSQLFPGRAPEGHDLYTVFVGGDLDAPAASLDDVELRALVLADLRRAFGGHPHAEPALFEITRWPRAIPQYWVGHRGRLRHLDEALAALPGLRVLGNWRGGIAMDACIREAKRAGVGGAQSAGSPGQPA